METLKVKFVDFWEDLNKPEGNYFYELLSGKYHIEFSDDPEVLFYSCYGREYLKYRCTRIFFSAESHRPDFTVCDYAITFDYNDDPRHFRFPLWALYYNGYVKWHGFKELNRVSDDHELLSRWENKKGFCCFVVSNPKAKKRIDFFLKLNETKKVDSAGRYLNNIGYLLEGGSLGKVDFIKNYRFVISFENESFSGYTTEKLIEPLLVGSIPIYWGDPSVGRDFNKKRILCYDDYPTEEALIDRIMEIENDKEEAIKILSEKVFFDDKTCVSYLEEKLLDFLYIAIEKSNTTRPVSQNPFNYWIHYYKIKKSQIVDKLGRIKGTVLKKIDL